MKLPLASFILFVSIFLSGCVFEKEEIRESVSKGLSPKSLFDESQELIDAGAVDEAIRNFERLQAAYPSSKYSIQAKLEIVYALYKRERYDEAIDKLNDFIKVYPSHFSTAYAYFMRGVISEDKSKSIIDDFLTDNAQRDVSSVRDAMNYYLAVIKKFPKTEYSDVAKSKMVVLRNTLSRHELFVAIFYTKKNAYIASINRCKFIIEKYPNTPSVPAALHLMAHNYDKINAPILAKDARRVLKESYPKYIPHYSIEE